MIKLNDTKRLQVFSRDNYTCQKCGKPATEIAHRIANTKSNALTCSKNVINHPFNLVASCQKCNDYFNIGNKPEIAKRLVELTKTNLHKWTMASEIERRLK